MKIAILTLPLHTNYGGILQAYALQTTLERQGHNVEIIQLNRKDFRLTGIKKYFIYFKRIIEKFIFKKNVIVFKEHKIIKYNKVINKNMQQFIDHYINILFIDSWSCIYEKQFDAYVVGSDQVWRPIYFNNYSSIENAFLKFTEGWNVKRVAYAPSFGTDNWEYTQKQTRECKRLIKSFDAVSVREDSGIKLCNDKLGINVIHVLDPTFLLSKDDYINHFSLNKVPKSSGTLLNYILDDTPQKQKIIGTIAKKKGMVSFKVNADSNILNDSIENRIKPSVESWLRGFYDAELIITDSFHACVFSIIFEKPFIIIGNEKRGNARIKSLLKTFGIDTKVVNSCIIDDNVEELKVNKNIISNDVFLSLKFLEGNLK